MFLEAVGKRIFSFSHKNAQQNDIIRKNISYCVVRRSYNNRRRLLKLLPTMQQQVYCHTVNCCLIGWLVKCFWIFFFQTYINYLKFVWLLNPSRNNIQNENFHLLYKVITFLFDTQSTNFRVNRKQLFELIAILKLFSIPGKCT